MYTEERSVQGRALLVGIIILALLAASLGAAMLYYQGDDDSPSGGEAEPDTDGDGMSDPWEDEYGLDVNDPSDADEDLDNDGDTNLEEFEGLDGVPGTGDETDPTDAGSVGIPTGDKLDPDDPGTPALYDAEPLRMDDEEAFMRTGTLEELERLADMEGDYEFTNANPDGVTVPDGNSSGYQDDVDYDGDGMTDSPEAGAGMDAEDGDRDKNAGGGDSAEREVEEADIIKVAGDYLYLLNPYRGLLVVDISDPDEPEVVGRAKVIGNPIDMYVVGKQAYIGVSRGYSFWYSYWLMEGARAGDAIQYQIGSQIMVVNLFDAADPVVVDTIDLEGQLTDTRRVGDVIYAVSSCGWSYRYYHDDDEAEDMTYVVSINVADPYNVEEVERVEFPGSSNHIHASSTALFVGQPEWHEEDEWDEGEGVEDDEVREPVNATEPTDTGGRRSSYTTGVTYVDIADPEGDIQVMDNFVVDGFLQDRFSMDHYKDTFRIVTHFWDGIGESKLWIFDVADPADIELEGSLLIDDAGSLMATRFAGERGYTIHLPRSVDPLDVLDLSDPSDPKLCDVFEMPGWVEHMEVRGYKILALGVDDSEGETNVAVSLFDVTDPYNVIMEERVRIGEGSYTWSTANWDDKALTVVDEQNIILVPFDSYDWEERNSGYTTGVQIVEFDLKEDTLTLRGSIEHMDTVTRTRATDDRLLLTSNRALQVVDATDRDNPDVTAEVELYVNVMDLVEINGRCVQMVNQDWDEPMELRTVGKNDPDSTQPLATIELDVNNAQMWVRGDHLVVLGSGYDNELYEYEVFLMSYDYSDPDDPTLAEKLELPADAYRYGYYFGCLDGYGGYGMGSDGMRTSNEVMFTDSGVMVIHPSYDYYYYDYYYGYEEMGRRSGDDDQRTNQTLYMIDISDPGNPVLLPQYIFSTYSIYNMMSMEDTIFFTEMEYVGSYDDGDYYAPQKIRYQLGRVDLSDPEQPVRKGGVNIPGTLLGVSAEGEVIYTISRWYLEEAEGYVYIQTINALEISDGFAYLRSAVVEEDVIRGLVVEDRAIYYCTGPQYYYYYYWYGDGWDAVDAGNISTTFHVLDFSDPAAPVRVSSTTTSGYSSLITVQEGHAFFRVDYGGGVMIYDLDDPEEPELLGLYLTQSYSSMRIYSQRVLLVQGVYGVMTVHFGTGSYD